MKLTTRQRAYVAKKGKYHEPDPSEMAGELNIVPFLDIVVNLIMFLLATTVVAIALTQLEATLPSQGRGGRGGGVQGLNLSVFVTQNGVVVTGSGGKLAPGCDTTGAGEVITVPRRGNSYDWAGLTACVAKVKRRFQDERQVTINANGTIEFEHVVAAMDAVRSQGDTELFPEVLLSAGVR